MQENNKNQENKNTNICIISDAYKKANLCGNLGSVGHWSCKKIIIWKEKHPCFHTEIIKAFAKVYYLSEKLTLSQKAEVTSEGAISDNVLYYQQLSITRYQVTFYTKMYFE